MGEYDRSTRKRKNKTKRKRSEKHKKTRKKQRKDNLSDESSDDERPRKHARRKMDTSDFYDNKDDSCYQRSKHKYQRSKHKERHRVRKADTSRSQGSSSDTEEGSVVRYWGEGKRTATHRDSSSSADSQYSSSDTETPSGKRRK